MVATVDHSVWRSEDTASAQMLQTITEWVLEDVGYVPNLRLAELAIEEVGGEILGYDPTPQPEQVIRP